MNASAEIIFLGILSIVVWRTRRANKKLVLFLICSLFLICIYEMNLLLHGRITGGSDSQEYYEMAVKGLMIYDDSTNFGYPILNWLFFHDIEERFHWWKMCLLLITNSLVFYLAALKTWSTRKDSYSIVVMVSPFVLYILTKNLRDSWIILGIVLCLSDDKLSRIVGIGLLALFRPSFAIFYCIASILAWIIKKASGRFEIKRPLLFIAIVMSMTAIVIIGILYEGNVTARGVIAQGFSMGEGDAVRLGKTGRTLDEVYGMSANELISKIPIWFASGSFKLIVGPSAFAYLGDSQLIENPHFPIWYNWIDYLIFVSGSFWTTFLVLPTFIAASIFVFFSKIGRERQNQYYKQLGNFLFGLLVLVQYAFAMGGGSDLRVRQTILILLALSGKELYKTLDGTKLKISYNSVRLLAACALIMIIVLQVAI